MNKPFRITVVSTRTVDRMPPGPNGERREMPGGPVVYTCRALDRLGVAHRVVTGKVALVDVIVGPDGEHYVIPALPAIPMPDRLEGEAAILSPIMREIPPERVPPVEGLLALDLQGFVREPPGWETGKSVDLVELLERADVVKAAEHELLRLDEPSLAALRGAIVLVTRGAGGAIIRRGDKEYFIAARPVAARHTIGAGDSFLAAFVVSLLDCGDVQQAGEQAARFTETVLAERNPEET